MNLSLIEKKFLLLSDFNKQYFSIIEAFFFETLLNRIIKIEIKNNSFENLMIIIDINFYSNKKFYSKIVKSVFEDNRCSSFLIDDFICELTKSKIKSKLIKETRDILKNKGIMNSFFHCYYLSKYGKDIKIKLLNSLNCTKDFSCLILSNDKRLYYDYIKSKGVNDFISNHYIRIYGALKDSFENINKYNYHSVSGNLIG